MELLKQLVDVRSAAGDEGRMKEFILDYIKNEQSNWKVQPKLIDGRGFQDCLILIFGEPSTAIYAHMDSIGFTTRYDNQLVPIGGPEAKTGYVLVGKDSLGPIECKMKVDEDHNLFYAVREH